MRIFLPRCQPVHCPDRALGSLVLIIFLLLVTPATAQSPTLTAPPPVASLTPTATPTPAVISTITPAMAVEVRQPPSAAKSFWETYGPILVGALLTGILVGVFLKRIAEAIADKVAWLTHFLFARFASAPLFRGLYYRDYCQNLADHVRELASSKIVDRPVDLEQVYIPIQLTTQMRANVDEEADPLRWSEARLQQQLAYATEPWETVRQHTRLIVLGEPGAGKTTYLCHLAFTCAQGKAPSDFAKYTPIYIPLRELVGVEKLEDALPNVLEKFGFPHAAGFCRRQLFDGRWLILLDGLDELDSQEQYAQVMQLVERFAARWSTGRDTQEQQEQATQSMNNLGDQRPTDVPRNIVVVSCRTYVYAHSPQLHRFEKAEVMDFDDDAIIRFADVWFRTNGAPELTAPFDDLIKKHRRLRELARNPLLLLLVADHFRREWTLPRDRVDLYTDCVETRIATWNNRRGARRGRFGKAQKRNLLRTLALDLYLEGQRNHFREDELLIQIEDFLSATTDPPGSSAHLLAEIVADSGLLRKRATDSYGFSHLTLQEFLAAEALARRSPHEAIELMQRHLVDDRWQEVIQLYCRLAINADPLMKRMLVRAENDGKLGWLQAGRCLAEGARVSEEIRRQVADGLLTLLKGGDNALTSDESATVVTLLWEGAPNLVPDYVRDLLDYGNLTLAAQILRADRDIPANLADLQEKLSAHLATVYERGDETQRRAAVAALSSISIGSDWKVVNALLHGLEEPHPPGRAQAARALGRLGTSNDTVVATLRRAFEMDSEQEVRIVARNSLLLLGRPELVNMVLIPAGNFLMGSPQGKGNDNETPQHTVYLPDYYISRTPVTHAEYQQFVKATKHREPSFNEKWATPYNWDQGEFPAGIADHPVVLVSWHDAAAYAAWAGMRLPSEAEWEKSARGIDGREWPWGNEWNAKLCNTAETWAARSLPTHRDWEKWWEAEYRLKLEGKQALTTPVGAYSSAGGGSPYSVEDMAGNVWEWTADWYQPYPETTYRSGAFGEKFRVLRGGAWFHRHSMARTAYRRRIGPGDYDNTVGFRCCISKSSL
jgi:sulfatase modifying factor 1